MEVMNRFRIVVVGCMLLLAGVLIPGRLPSAPQQAPLPGWPRDVEQAEQPNEAAVKAILKGQHEQMKKDADRLLQLATELKSEVDKTNSETLSVKVIKKAEEIEKLAKKIQSRMKG